MVLKKPLVFLYHRVGLPAYENDNMPPEEFDKQMRYFATQGYRTISPERYFSFLNGKRDLPPCSFLLTFDDGAKNIMDYAFPIIKKYNFKAVIFLNTAYIGKVMYHSRENRKFYKTQEEALADSCYKEKLLRFSYLSWPEIKFLAEEGMNFGFHGHSHLVLTKLTRKRLLEELNIPRDILSKKIGQEINYFSYPWGTFNRHVKRYVKAAGYKVAFATNHSHREDIFSVKRILIRTRSSLDDFICLINENLYL